eukprot:425467_1
MQISLSAMFRYYFHTVNGYFLGAMADKHLRLFVSNWKNTLSSIKKGEGDMNAFYNEMNEFIDDKMVLFSPAIHKPSNNALYNKTILKWVIEIIEEFHYKNIDYYDGNTNRVGMTFGGKIQDPKSKKYFDIEGIDLIKLNEKGKVIELKVMMRPLNSLILLATTMKNRFKKLNKL